MRSAQARTRACASAPPRAILPPSARETAPHRFAYASHSFERNLVNFEKENDWLRGSPRRRPLSSGFLLGQLPEPRSRIGERLTRCPQANRRMESTGGALETNMDSQPISEEQPVWKLVLVFAGRFLCSILVFAIVVVFASKCLMYLDGQNIMRKALSCFAPYASSLPWILVIISITLILCIPRAPTAIADIASHIEQFGPVKFQLRTSSYDPSIVEEAYREIQQDDADSLEASNTSPSPAPFPVQNGDEKKDLATSQPDNVADDKPEAPAQREKKARLARQLLVAIKTVRHRRKQILDFHAVRIGASIIEFNVQSQPGAARFDAVFKKGREYIFIKVLSISSPNILNTYTALQYSRTLLTENARRHSSIHFLVYAKDEQIASIPSSIFDIDTVENSDITPFLYLIDQSGKIHTLEEETP